jgi:hypothetical protein
MSVSTIWTPLICTKRRLNLGRRNREVAPGSGVFECNPNSPPQALSGTQVLDFDAARGISVLSFRPTQALPGNVCIEANITDGVADLSGRPAQPQTLSFRTVVVPQVEESVVEPFDNEDQLDADQSAAVWSGPSGSITTTPVDTVSLRNSALERSSRARTCSSRCTACSRELMPVTAIANVIVIVVSI